MYVFKLLIFIFVVVSLRYLVLGQEKCPSNKYGRHCRLHCQCRDSGYDCQASDRQTCVTCNDAMYDAPSCQKENIARNRPSLSALTINVTAAFDDDLYTCMNESGGEWFQVDLGKIRPIGYMEIYKTREHFRGGFKIIVSNNPGYKNGSYKSCYVTSSTLSGREELFHQCSQQKGRFVTLATSLLYSSYLKLCDVKIFECADFTYGRNCDQECNCLNVTEVCHKSNGMCISGCATGYRGTSCNLECLKPYYGVNCQRRCRCVDDRQCNHVDGGCADGKCQTGYMSEVGGIQDCQKKCPSGSFGKKCTGVCHCVDDSLCNHINGTCEEGRCAPGWFNFRYHSEKCQDECHDGKFGRYCVKSCNCHNEVCVKTTGACPITGCKAGYTGEDCQLKCPDGKFGKGCTSIRITKDKNKICAHESGICSSKAAQGVTVAGETRGMPTYVTAILCVAMLVIGGIGTGIAVVVAMKIYKKRQQTKLRRQIDSPYLNGLNQIPNANIVKPKNEHESNL